VDLGRSGTGAPRGPLRAPPACCCPPTLPSGAASSGRGAERGFGLVPGSRFPQRREERPAMLRNGGKRCWVQTVTPELRKQIWVPIARGGRRRRSWHLPRPAVPSVNPPPSRENGIWGRGSCCRGQLRGFVASVATANAKRRQRRCVCGCRDVSGCRRPAGAKRAKRGRGVSRAASPVNAVRRQPPSCSGVSHDAGSPAATSERGMRPRHAGSSPASERSGAGRIAPSAPASAGSRGRRVLGGSAQSPFV